MLAPEFFTPTQQREANWYERRKKAVDEYLKSNGVCTKESLSLKWYVPQCVELWGTNNANRVWVFAWADDSPMDLLQEQVEERQAVKTFCQRLFEIATSLQEGQHTPRVVSGPMDVEQLKHLGFKLKCRARLLRRWTKSTSEWAVGLDCAQSMNEQYDPAQNPWGL